jgi:hypothetical protein
MFILTAMAGVKCETEVDAFTDQTVTRATWNKRFTMESLAPEGVKWNLSINHSGAVNVELPTGWELLLKLDDGTKMSVTSISPSPSETHVTENSVYTIFRVNFMLTDAQVAASPIAVMRWDIAGKTTSWNVTGKWQKQFAKAFECVAG